MKIALAQTSPVKGNIEANLLRHADFTIAAADAGAQLILFSELSLTGYEPELADGLATTVNDERLAPLAYLSQQKNITICAGLPTRQPNGVCISTLAFYPNGERRLFSKQFLHPDELPFFTPAEAGTRILDRQNSVGLAICYELSVEAQLQQLLAEGIKIYVAAVAKSAAGMNVAAQRLAIIAKTHHLPALLVNCVGEYDNTLCSGGSAVWDATGCLQAQLSSTESMLLWDSTTGATACQSVAG